MLKRVKKNITKGCYVNCLAVSRCFVLLAELALAVSILFSGFIELSLWTWHWSDDFYVI